MAHILTERQDSVARNGQGSQTQDLLRFITCGSVDDGKSTLIGRLLYESNMLFDVPISQLEAESK
jgi:bifunctional enzyme CysN/CysC